MLRAGVTLLFEGGAAEAVPAGAEVSVEGDDYRAALAHRLDLRFSPVSEPVMIGGTSARVCRVRGTVAGAHVDCLGTASEDLEAPRWADLDALRSVSALWDPRTALLLDARRPRFALGHGQEWVEAQLLRDGTVTRVGEARLSTVYDARGRQRTAGLELWTGEEDLPRRAAGTAIAGSSIELEGLHVEAAVFAWSMEGREGFGAYEITFRDGQPTAA